MNEPPASQSNEPHALTIVVVEDHPLMREAVIAAIETEPAMRVVGQAEDGVAAVAEVLRCRPDVVVMDLFLPKQGGVAAITAIKEQAPAVQILALTSAADETVFLAALQAGATGYLIKDSRRGALIDAIRQVAQGIVVATPQMSSALVRRTVEGYTLPEALSARERDLLRLIGAGATNNEIAAQLFLGESTVRTYVHNLLEKLKLENRNQLVLYAVRIGIARQSDNPV
jgi:DNA-binding NarL/FixJ family response regulator